MRASARGYKPWFEPAAIVEHTHEGTLPKYATQFFKRGREFAPARAIQEAWSRGRIAAHLAAGPLIAPMMMARTGLCAAQCGWISGYAMSFFHQLVFRVAWSAGEMAGEAVLLSRVSSVEQ